MCSIEHQDVFICQDDKMTTDIVGDVGVGDGGGGGDESPTYLDISTNTTLPIKTEPDTKMLINWTENRPEDWSQFEVLDWFYFLANTIDVDPTTLRLEEFQNITGSELCRMTLEDFQKRDPINGMCFFNIFRRFARYESTTAEPIVTKNTGNELHVLLGSQWYDIDTCVEIPSSLQPDSECCPEENIFGTDWEFCPEEGHFGDSDSESVSDISDISITCTGMRRTTSTGSEFSDGDEEMPTALKQSSHINMKKKTLSGRRSSTETGEQRKQQNRGRKPGQPSKGNHLWEFIRDLLKDPQTNPNLLRWEEKETGVFRFVRSEAVAQMWGQKKNNPDMTYEKLSRAMRFCRTAGYFAAVPKTGKFPKKLCFRFGAKAYGWEN